MVYIFNTKYKILPYRGGWAVFVKKHWYSGYKKYDMCYFSKKVDAYSEFRKKLANEHIEYIERNDVFIQV